MQTAMTVGELEVKIGADGMLVSEFDASMSNVVARCLLPSLAQGFLRNRQ